MSHVSRKLRGSIVDDSDADVIAPMIGRSRSGTYVVSIEDHM